MVQEVKDILENTKPRICRNFITATRKTIFYISNDSEHLVFYLSATLHGTRISFIEKDKSKNVTFTCILLYTSLFMLQVAFYY